MEKWTNQRIKNAKLYENFLKKNKKISLPKKKEYSKHVYHLFVIKTNNRNHQKKNKLQRFIKLKNLILLIISVFRFLYMIFPFSNEKKIETN